MKRLAWPVGDLSATAQSVVYVPPHLCRASHAREEARQAAVLGVIIVAKGDAGDVGVGRRVGHNVEPDGSHPADVK